jgi:hypothetical protein
LQGTTDSPQLFGNLRVLDPAGLVQTQPPHPLGHVTATGDRASTSKSFELDVGDDPGVVDLDLELHHVSASRGSYEACAYVGRVLVEGADLRGLRLRFDLRVSYGI